MSRLTLLHRDLSRRIESLKQIVEASQVSSGLASTVCCGGPHHPPHHVNGSDMHSIDLKPNTNQLILRSTQRKLHQEATMPTTSSTKSRDSVKLSTPRIPPAQRGESLDEGFESDVDTISLVSTESTISLVTKNRETDSANGSASSDSDDSEGTKDIGTTTTTNAMTSELLGPTAEDEIITECFNLVNCVCYTDSTHPDILILVVSPPDQEEETLIFKFDNKKELETFHENFSTVKAVTSQKSSKYGCIPFNLLQRTDSDGMTHIRISKQNDYNDYDNFTSIISLPDIPHDEIHPGKLKFDKFATMGKPPRKRVLKKSKSIEDMLDPEKPLLKVWSSAENILHVKDAVEKPKPPPRKGRKKGPAPLPPPHHSTSLITEENVAYARNPSQSFTSLSMKNSIVEDTSVVGNVFQGQFVRVQVDHQSKPPSYPLLMNFQQRTGPEIIKYESSDDWKQKGSKVKNFDAFKFSDPKNISGIQQKDFDKAEIKTKTKRGLSALKLFIPMYKSAKKQPPPSTSLHSSGIYQRHVYPIQQIPPLPAQPSSGTFTNRLFGMSSKLKEFSSLQSGCNPNKRYNQESNLRTINSLNTNVNPYAQPVKVNQDGKLLGRLGKLGRSGSLGNLTLLSNQEKSQSNTLKSVIKKRTKDDDDSKKFGRHGKKVTFSAYNTVQVV